MIKEINEEIVVYFKGDNFVIDELKYNYSKKLSSEEMKILYKVLMIIISSKKHLGLFNFIDNFYEFYMEEFLSHLPQYDPKLPEYDTRNSILFDFLLSLELRYL